MKKKYKHNLFFLTVLFITSCDVSQKPKSKVIQKATTKRTSTKIIEKTKTITNTNNSIVSKDQAADTEKIKKEATDFKHWLETYPDEKKKKIIANKQMRFFNYPDAWKDLSTDKEKQKWAYDAFYSGAISNALPAMEYLTNSPDSKIAELTLRLFAAIEARQRNYQGALKHFEEGVRKLMSNHDNYDSLTDKEIGLILGNYCMRGTTAQMCEMPSKELHWRKETIRLAQKHGLDCAQYHINYAWVLSLSGQKKEAIIELKSAINLVDDNEQQLQLIQEDLKKLEQGYPAGFTSSL